MKADQLKSELAASESFRLLYPDTGEAVHRYCGLIDAFAEKYGDGDLSLFSSPGRTEIGGNHTDHQRGRVLAGAVNLDIIAAVKPTTEPRIRISSRGYSEINVEIDKLNPIPSEAGSPAALIRGMAAGFREKHLPAPGFDACVDSQVYPGSGLSSSAAFATLIGVILKKIGGSEIPDTEIASLAQKSENLWFGKPCGLMDQMACAVGGLTAIDFKDPETPDIQRIDFDFSVSGHSLCITGPIGSHADLTDAYSAIPREMKGVAQAMGKDLLREVEPRDFFTALPSLLGKQPDRALLRAVHFFAENERVLLQADALRRGDFPAFLGLVNESGRSSFQYLQNVCHQGEQLLAIAIAESERILKGAGAIRVHGGGFAGTIQAFVPSQLVNEYSGTMDRLFGDGACKPLCIRPIGAAALE